MIRKTLKRLFVIQEISNEKIRPRLGRGYSTAIRLNPFNPLSYFVLIISLIIGIICFGVVVFWKEADLRNPFKWN